LNNKYINNNNNNTSEARSNEKFWRGE